MDPPHVQGDDTDELTIELRPAREVAARCIILAGFCRWAYLILAPITLEPQEANAQRFDLHSWLQLENLAHYVAPSEHRSLATPHGRASQEHALTMSWGVEALMALAWSLDRVPYLPSFEVLADPTEVLEMIPQPWDSTAMFLADARLRAETEIAAERERAELWHWRCDLADILPKASPVERRELLVTLREVTQEAAAAGLIINPVDNDFAVGEQPFQALTASEVAAIGAVAAERHRALNWLCGFGPDWDHVPVDI